MSAQVGILTDAGEHLLSLKDLKKLKKPPRRLPAGVEKGHRSMIGRGFLRYRILHEGTFSDALGPQQGSAAPATFSGDCSSGSEHHRDNAFDTGVPRSLLKARQMSARDMAGLMRQHADQLVRRLRPHDQAGIDELVLAAGDKGVKLLV